MKTILFCALCLIATPALAQPGPGPQPPTGANPSVGTNTAASPTSSTQIGIKDGSGNLQPVSPANPVPIQTVGSSGTPTATAVSVTNANTQLAAAAAFSNFVKIAVPLNASTGIWVRWDGGTATAATPAEYLAPGQSATWVKSSGYLPTSAINAISNSASTVSISVIGG